MAQTINIETQHYQCFSILIINEVSDIDRPSIVWAMPLPNGLSHTHPYCFRIIATHEITCLSYGALWHIINYGKTMVVSQRARNFVLRVTDWRLWFPLILMFTIMLGINLFVCVRGGFVCNVILVCIGLLIVIQPLLRTGGPGGRLV